MPVEALFSITEPGQSHTKEVCKGRVVGIDLGTTNSLVGVVQAGTPACLRDANGTLVPSVVHYAKDGSVVVGVQARALAVQTCLGAGRMLAEDGAAPAELRRRVTSPNGTTQAALESFAASGFPAIVTQAVQAATRRGRELSAQLDD